MSVVSRGPGYLRFGRQCFLAVALVLGCGAPPFGSDAAPSSPSVLHSASPSPRAAVPTSRIVTSTKDGLNYVWIPAGRFQMGCSTGDQFCRPSERPAHLVTITKGFWIGQTPVTQAAYRRVMGSNPSRFLGNQKPVDSVTWAGAQAYCGKVGMRLPTEAEWEYAERSGRRTARYAPIAAIAWYKEDAGGTTHEVGLKVANDAGLYDMMGNVMEWVSDWWGPYSARAQTDPRGPSQGSDHVLRGGGGWWSCPEDIRMSSRSGGDYPPNQNVDGFRCAAANIADSTAATPLPIAAPEPYRIIDRWTLDKDNPLRQVEIEADWAKVKSDESWHGMAIDAKAQLLYVARDSRVDVISTETRRLVGAIEGLRAARAIALDTDGIHGFVADSAAHRVLMFDRRTLARMAAWNVAPLSPDELLFDSATHTVWAFDAKGKRAVVLAEGSHSTIGALAFQESPRAAATDDRGAIYVALGEKGPGDPGSPRQTGTRKKGTLVRIDAHTRSITGKWPLTCSSPSGVALDPADQRLLVVVCRDEKTVVMSAVTGKVLATIPIDEDAAGAAFDARKGLAFVAANDGFLDVINVRRTAYPMVERLITYPGADGLAYDPDHDRIITVSADTQMISPPTRHGGPEQWRGGPAGGPPQQEGGPDRDQRPSGSSRFGGDRPLGPQHLMGENSPTDTDSGRPGRGLPHGWSGRSRPRGADHGPSKRIVIPGTFTVFMIGTESLSASLENPKHHD